MGADTPRSAEFRYRISVVVHDGLETHKGSAVWQLVLTRPPVRMMDEFSASFAGDAVPVRLGDGSVLVLLLQRWRPEQMKGPRVAPSEDAGTLPRLVYGNDAHYAGHDEIARLSAIANTPLTRKRLVCKPSLFTTSQSNQAGAPKQGEVRICFKIAYSQNPKTPEALREITAQAYGFTRSTYPQIDIYVEPTNSPVDRPLDAVFPWLKPLLAGTSRASRPLSLSPAVQILRR
ncbi:hypothetical protein GGQ80_002470 [Sphingomonas jinjuensis]|uniref:Uncharacterized protein n=1 Tax=Sphingomonas jinjuensis TaxID=535907 RepID=A0A840FFS2_9SPHN|nr:hypothetical protein [Sphingomonas jinjuensis]